MARKARVYSPSGYSHVIVKGIGGMVLFEASEDYAFFLNRMKEYSEETKLCICAYCLMNNHVHLLVYDADKSLPLFFKKICVSYSWYFNHKHGRTGHVFQDRYKSFEKLMEEMMCNAFMTWADIWNIILRSGDKEKLRVYECGFVSELNHQMEKIEMLVNAGLGKDNIVDEMGYTYG